MYTWITGLTPTITELFEILWREETQDVSLRLLNGYNFNNC